MRSYSDAASKCSEKNQRLCSKDELLSGICCGTGGNCDSDKCWTSTSELRFWVDDGCTRAGKHHVGSFQYKSYEAGVRCCSNDGTTCETPLLCQDNKMTYGDAILKCSEDSRRLCSRDELLSKICCGTGGNCDSYKIWTSTSDSGTYKSFI